MPATIDSNITGLSIAEEASLRVLPGAPAGTAVKWQRLEPNTYSNFGGDTTLVARETINPTRQIQRGTITGVTAKGGWNMDLTQSNFTELAQGFFFASYTRNFSAAKDGGGVAIPDGAKFTTPTPYTAGLVKTGSLIFGRNYALAGNNGLKVVTAANAGAGTITAAGTTAEAVPPAAASLDVVGYEAGALAVVIAGNLVQLTSGTDDFTTLGLQIGQWLFTGGDATVNQFATNSPGYGRISAIAAGTLTFDLTTFAAVAEGSTVGKKIRLFFGKYLQNAAVVSAIDRRTYHIERTLGNDPSAAPQAEYLVGSIPNTATLNFPQKAKATVDVEFVAMDATYRGSSTTPNTLISALGSYVNAPGEPPMNTSSDLYMVRIAPVDPLTLNPVSLFQFATDAKITIANSVTPDDALTVVGAIEATAGDFAVGGTATVYFTDVKAIAAIRNNTDICMQTILAKKNAGMLFDTPLMSVSGGQNKIEKGKPVTLALTQSAAQNPNGYTLSASFYDYLPTSAMPSQA